MKAAEPGHDSDSFCAFCMLSPELTSVILNKLDLVGLHVSRFVCRQWRDLIGNRPRSFAREAVRAGHLSILRWAHRAGCPFKPPKVPLWDGRGGMSGRANCYI